MQATLQLIQGMRTIHHLPASTRKHLPPDTLSGTSVTEPACAMSTNTEQADRRARQKACSGALADSLQMNGIEQCRG